jgi:enamine deaminase RidA (YjgF/YER057c/UK114 family)
MTVRRIDVPELAPGRGYSPVVVVESGRLAFLAGQTAQDESGTIRGETVVEQFDHALANLLTALAAAGGTPDGLAKLTIYAVDPAAYRRNARAIGEAWRARVGRAYPAIALVGVTSLWDPAALIELDAIAALPEHAPP